MKLYFENKTTIEIIESHDKVLRENYIREIIQEIKQLHNHIILLKTTNRLGNKQGDITTRQRELIPKHLTFIDKIKKVTAELYMHTWNKTYIIDINANNDAYNTFNLTFNPIDIPPTIHPDPPPPPQPPP